MERKIYELYLAVTAKFFTTTVSYNVRLSCTDHVVVCDFLV